MGKGAMSKGLSGCIFGFALELGRAKIWTTRWRCAGLNCMGGSFKIIGANVG